MKSYKVTIFVDDEKVNEEIYSFEINAKNEAEATEMLGDMLNWSVEEN